MKEIFETIRHIIAEETGIEEEDIKPGSDLADDLNLDPLEVSDLLLAVEEKYKLESLAISPEEVGTVAELVSIVQEELNEI